jgi:hypothetical protein
MSSSTNSAVDDLKSGIKGIHGIGESIRGSINGAVDYAAHDTTGEVQNRAVVNKGEAEMRQGEAAVDKNRSAGNTTITTASAEMCKCIR